MVNRLLREGRKARMAKVDMDKIIRKSLNESVDDLLWRAQHAKPENRQIEELIKEMATVIRLQHKLLKDC